jgi:hypothetical protein
MITYRLPSNATRAFIDIRVTRIHHPSRKKHHGLAWAERHGKGFRVRYRLADGTLTSETDFPTITAARDRAADIDSEQRRGTFV